MTLRVTEQCLEEYGFCNADDVSREVVHDILEQCQFPLNTRGYVRRKLREDVSDIQRAKTDTTRSGIKYRRWGKCLRRIKVNTDEYVSVWMVVDMMEGPVKMVTCALDVMGASLRKDLAAYHETVKAVNQKRDATGRRRYEIPPDLRALLGIPEYEE
jgi:hypothetical protein